MINGKNKPVTLKRSLGLTLITFYGLGTIVGGGFYALVGKVSGAAGMLTPMAFLAAAVIALFSAFSFAELSARLPYSAGESRYVLEAFKRNWLAGVIGWMVICTGVVSAATLANAFAGFLTTLIPLPDWLVILTMVLGLGFIAAWGIGESVWLATVITVIEVGGLLFVFAYASPNLQSLGDRWGEIMPALRWSDWNGIFVGAYLAFYSFVGFEDMVNVAEEVKHPQRNLPIAIMLSLALTGLLYFGVTLVTVLAVPQSELVASDSPLSLALGDWTTAAAVITTIGMLAGLNGALVQIIMASRVAYGMAEKGQAPAYFARVHPTRRTPLPATIAASLVVLALALWFPLLALAKATSTVLLVVYTLVNVSLVKIKWSEREEPTHEGPNYPIWLPLVGAIVCFLFVLFNALSWIL